VARPRVDYERHGHGYARNRHADPRIEARIHAALGDARTVLNVGAGSGSYEPYDREVLAVEPSATMRAQRPPGAAPALDARAEALPFADDSFDAAMACLTIHHWEPPEAGLRELRRVARGPVVVFTFELESLPAWQLDFLAEGVELERPRWSPAPGTSSTGTFGTRRASTARCASWSRSPPASTDRLTHACGGQSISRALRARRESSCRRS